MTNELSQVVIKSGLPSPLFDNLMVIPCTLTGEPLEHIYQYVLSNFPTSLQLAVGHIAWNSRNPNTTPKIGDILVIPELINTKESGRYFAFCLVTNSPKESFTDFVELMTLTNLMGTIKGMVLVNNIQVNGIHQLPMRKVSNPESSKAFWDDQFSNSSKRIIGEKRDLSVSDNSKQITPIRTTIYV